MHSLNYIPDLGKVNDVDQYEKDKIRKIKPEFSEGNKRILLSTMKNLPRCKIILEIGVARKSRETSSTWALLENKPKDCWYFGVDVQPRDYVYSWPVADDKTILLNVSSSQLLYIMDIIEKKSSYREIDLIHIDGRHSVNQVLEDWQFALYLTTFGAVVLHDTNYHPGPVELVKAIDRKKFTVRSYFKKEKNDWGITVVKRRV
jgi:cephalosporin hydroxylase